MAVEFSQTARRLGISSAVAVAVLLVVYAVTLAAGLTSLESPQDPIGDPFFTLLEVLIIVMMPAMVTLMVAVHAWAPLRSKALTLTSVVFMSMVAGVTSSLHFVILTLSRQAEFAELPSLPLVVSFKWPSVAYALDILAWDVFFALSMLFAAPIFGGSRLAVSVKALMVASGLLALAGLSGVPAGDMGLRNIGIAGYVGVFLAVAVLLAVLFHRSKATDQIGRERAD
jgi:hypothetical protein